MGKALIYSQSGNFCLPQRTGGVNLREPCVSHLHTYLPEWNSNWLTADSISMVSHFSGIIRKFLNLRQSLSKATSRVAIVCNSFEKVRRSRCGLSQEVADAIGQIFCHSVPHASGSMSTPTMKTDNTYSKTCSSYSASHW